MEWKESHTNSGGTSVGIVAVTMRAHAHLRDAPVIQRLDILPSRRRKRVVRATPSSFCEGIFFCIRTREQRKLGDPKKVRDTCWGIDPCAVTSQLESGVDHC